MPTGWKSARPRLFWRPDSMIFADKPSRRMMNGKAAGGVFPAVT